MKRTWQKILTHMDMIKIFWHREFHVTVENKF